MTVIDLFCGAGGFTQGFKEAGFQVILGLDIEPKMLVSYRVNHPEVRILEEDALNLNPSGLPDVDIIIGSPPCQPFSTTSSKKPEEGMALVNWMLNLVKIKKPRFWVMENVPLVSKYLPRWIRNTKILNAADYGVPQTRRRCFAGDYPVPIPTHSKNPQITLDERVLKPWATMHNSINNHVPNELLALSKQEVESIKAERQDTTRHWGKMEFPDNLNKPSRTITWERGTLRETIIVPVLSTQGYRRLATSERAHLQTFPDNYIFTGNPSWQHRQIGEAVPPLLAQRIAEEMLRR